MPNIPLSQTRSQVLAIESESIQEPLLEELIPEVLPPKFRGNPDHLWWHEFFTHEIQNGNQSRGINHFSPNSPWKGLQPEVGPDGIIRFKPNEVKPFSSNPESSSISTLESSGTEDLEPPQLLEFDFTPKSIDTNIGSQTVTFTLRITDNLSGVEGVYACFGSPSRQQGRCSYVGEWGRISGDGLDGIYQGTIEWPQYSEAGTWHLNYLSTWDKVGNSWWSGNEQEFIDLGFPTKLEVISVPDDTDSPRLVNFNFSPSSIDTSVGPQTVTFTFRITDNLSGVEGVYACFGSPSRQQGRCSYVGEWGRISGDGLDGIYQGTIEWPQYSEAGTWHLNYLSTWDKVGNSWWSGNEQEFIDLGFPTEIENGWGAVENQSPTISNLGQFKSDGIISIGEGNITTESTIIFKATLDDPENDKVKLQIELEEYDQSFNEQDLLESDFVSSGSEATITRYGLINGQYHWRARAIDDKGNTSNWQEFGEVGNVDFEVKLVPLYTQIPSPYPSWDETLDWSDDPYAQGIQYYCGSTIAQCGCAIVSSVMILRYYDVTNVHREDVNPGTLNEWLKNNKGYFAGNVNWLKIAEYSEYKVKYDTAKSGNYVNNYPLLDEYLNKNQPAIARQINPGHFMVVDNKLATTYGVKDSSWYNTKKLDELTTDWALKIRDYNNSFYGLRLFYPEDGIAMSAVSLTLASPAEILITDPSGRKLGKDSVLGVEYNEIPDGSYFTENIDDPTSELPPSNEESKVLYIGNPIDGQYNIEIIGTGIGSYSLNLLAYDQNGESEEVILDGSTITNNIQEFELNYSNQTIQQTEIYRIVNIDIKPGSYPNSINLKSKGVTPVAVLTDEFFDAKDIVIDSIVFAGTSPLRGNFEDVDNDDDLDLILHFKTQSLQLTSTDTEVVLTAQLTNGNLIKGKDSVRIVDK